MGQSAPIAVSRFQLRGILHPTSARIAQRGVAWLISMVVRVATAYLGAARSALLALKFNGQRRVAERLAALMVAPFANEIRTADMVMPVPLHPSRKRELLRRVRGCQCAPMYWRVRVRPPRRHVSRAKSDGAMWLARSHWSRPKLRARLKGGVFC